MFLHITAAGAVCKERGQGPCSPGTAWRPIVAKINTCPYDDARLHLLIISRGQFIMVYTKRRRLKLKLKLKMFLYQLI